MTTVTEKRSQILFYTKKKKEVEIERSHFIETISIYALCGLKKSFFIEKENIKKKKMKLHVSITTFKD